MSFAMSAPLQTAVYEALVEDTALNALIGDAVYDATPAGDLPPLHVQLGAEDVQDASDCSGPGALHRLTLSVITTLPGFSQAKEVAGVVSDVLHEAALELSRGKLIFLRFERARARRAENATTRQIDLRFIARVQDDEQP